MAKSQSKNTKAIAVPESHPLTAEVVASTSFIATFAAGWTQFFARATDLRVRAEETLVAANALKKPTSKAEDEALQTFIKRATSDEKEADQHWTVTAAVSRFHRMLTSERKKTEEPLSEAKQIAQGFHNAWSREEVARVERENEKRRQEEEIAAQKRRDEELAELERKAVEAEAASPTLSAREQVFVDSVLSGDAPPLAAHEAEFKDHQVAAKRLMNTEKIVKAIEAARAAAALRRQQSAVKAAPLVVEEIREEKAQVGKAGVDRTTWSAIVDDEAAFVDAVCEGTFGIPRDCLQINQAKLRQYAIDMHEGINRWPGVRASKKTTTV